MKIGEKNVALDFIIKKAIFGGSKHSPMEAFS